MTKILSFIKKISIVAVLTLVAYGFSSVSTVQASSIALTPPSVDVHEGDTFMVKVSADPMDLKQYTVRVNVAFTPGNLSLSSWKFNDEWTVLRQPGYDLFDNTTGTLVRTGGYPGGFVTPVSFGVATFTALKQGTASIELTKDSFIYNEASVNTYNGANKIIVNILPPAVATPSVTPTPKAPVVVPVKSYSFDIAIELQKPVVQLHDNLTSKIHITNTTPAFKGESVNIPVHYMIINGQGVVANEQFGTTTLTSSNTVYDYNVPVAYLPADTYTLVIRIEYPALIAPAESKVGFTINGPQQPPVKIVPQQDSSNLIYTAVVGTLLVFIVGLGIGLLIFKLIAHKKPHTTRRKQVDNDREE